MDSGRNVALAESRGQGAPDGLTVMPESEALLAVTFKLRHYRTAQVGGHLPICEAIHSSTPGADIYHLV